MPIQHSDGGASALGNWRYIFLNKHRLKTNNREEEEDGQVSHDQKTYGGKVCSMKDLWGVTKD